MNQQSAKFCSYQPCVIALLRIMTAFLFIQHATAKFWEFPVSMTDGQGSVALFSVMGFAGALELVGSILLLLGLFVRPVAFILSGMMAVAYIGFHVFQWSSISTFLTPMVNHGEPAVLFCIAFLFLFINGGGAYALDAKCKR